MNRMFRLVWNATQGSWVVASEIAKGKTKSKALKATTTGMIAAGLVAFASMSLAAFSSPEYSLIKTNDFWFDGRDHWHAWSVEANWNTGTVPTSDSSIMIDGANTVYVVNYNVSSILTIGSSDEGSLIISNNGTLTASDVHLGEGQSSSGRLTLDGGHVVDVTSHFRVGVNGSGTLNILNGGSLGTKELIIGSYTGSVGVVNIGSAANGDATAAGDLDATTINFGSGSGTLVLNHTNTDYVISSNLTNGSSSNSNINLLSGTTSFTGDAAGYNGAMTVDGGTLRIADDDRLSLGGDYNQTADGTLQIGASSSTSYGQLSVAGTADFAANSEINVDVATVNTLANGNLLDSVISAGTLNASTFNVTDNSALFDFAAVVNSDNTVDLTTQQSRTVSTSVRNRRATQNYSAASVLDSFMSGGTSGSDMDNVVTAFGRLATVEEVSEAVSETLPLMQGATTQAAANVMQTTGRIIRARQAMTSGLASGDGFIADKHGWVKPIGSWATQHSIDDSAGFTVDSYGIIGGVDGDISDNDTVGIALSYVDSSMKGENSTSRNSADIDAYQIAFYGQHDLGAEAYDLSVNWQADWGINKTEGKRHMSFIGRTAESDYDTYTTHVGVGVGRTFATAERTTLTPSVQLDYSHIENRRYTETGAGALNLSVSDDQIDAFVVSLQGDLMHEFNDQWALLGNAGVGYDLIDDDTSVTSTYAGGGTAFTTQGLNQAPWRVTAGVGVNYNLDDTTTLSANYDMQGKENFLSHTASAKVRWMF